MIRLRSTGVYHYPDPPDQGRPLSESRHVKSIEMTQRLVRIQAKPRLLIGEFEDTEKRLSAIIINRRFLMIYDDR